MATVEPVLQVYLGLSDHVISPKKVRVNNLDSQHRVLGDGGFHFKAPLNGNTLVTIFLLFSILLSKNGIELLGHIVFLVRGSF
jgi:hypothetical protein